MERHAPDDFATQMTLAMIRPDLLAITWMTGAIQFFERRAL